MKLVYIFTGLFFTCALFLSCSKNNYAGSKRAAGTSRVFVQDLAYLSGQIEQSTGQATWPVAIVPVDRQAVKYSVKLLKTGKTYEWEPGQATQSEYHVYPASNDIKDGKYYVGLGRTWCSGCSSVNPAWEQNYRNNVFAASNKVEITVYY